MADNYDAAPLIAHAKSVLEDGNKVLLVEKPNCPQCTATKRRLARYDAPVQTEPFTTVTLGLAAAAGFTSAPLVIVPGYGAWSGFKPGEIDAACKSL